MRASVVFVVLLLLVSLAAFGAGKTLDIYVVDVEGGNATLFVAPSGESLLIDTGNGGAHAVQPRAAIINNGARKGGQPEAMKVLHTIPGLEDIWQMHFSQLSGQEYTVPGMFIANTVDEPQAAMPVAPFQAPPPGPGATPAPVHNGAVSNDHAGEG